MSKNSQTFEVEMGDGKKYTVSTAFADVIALEDEFDIDASDLVVRQRGKWIAFMAWHALKRKKLIDMTFDEFRADIESIDGTDDEADSGNA